MKGDGNILIPCNECGSSISDKALFCPKCGLPLNVKTDNTVLLKTKTKRNKRLPNGFGQITKLKNKNLRKPYRAMVTIGKDEFAKPIVKLLKPEAYFHTYNEAYEALIKYNQNPYELSNLINFGELFDMWSKEYLQKIHSNSSLLKFRRISKYIEPLKHMYVREIRTKHLKMLIENAKFTRNNKSFEASNWDKIKLKEYLNSLFDYALENELTDKNYAKLFKLNYEITNKTSTIKNEHMSFSDEEVNILWTNINNIPDIKLILIQAYMGLRPSELCLIKTENVNLEKTYIKCGMKTKSGKDRLVPIHSKILNFIEEAYQKALIEEKKYLLTSYKNNTTLDYAKYSKIYNSILHKLNLDSKHKPHDPRVFFITSAKKFNVNEYAIKKIVGHTITDITEKIYTKRDIVWLKSEVEKIK